MRVIAVALLLAAAAVEAQPYQPVVMGAQQTCVGGESNSHRRTLEWVAPQRVEPDTSLFRIASNGSGRVYAITLDAPYQVLLVTPDGARTPFATGSGQASGLVVAENGRVYVRVARGGVVFVDRLSPAGVLEATYPLPVPFDFGDAFDVAADGCTLYYTSGNHRDRIASTIHRFNACTGAVLPDFGGVPYAEDLEVQPNGEVLVAGWGTVRLHGEGGTLVRTIMPGVAAYGFDPLRYVAEQVSLHAGVLWVVVNDPCAEGNLLRVSLEDGRELSRQRLAAVNVPYDLAFGAAAVAPIPAASDIMLALLAVVLAAAGVLVVTTHQQ